MAVGKICVMPVLGCSNVTIGKLVGLFSTVACVVATGKFVRTDKSGLGARVGSTFPLELAKSQKPTT
jgi:hypothetical protein